MPKVHPSLFSCAPGLTPYLACVGLGNAVAAQFTGRYADWTLRRWLRIRGGVYVPEDRLRAALWGGGTLLPLSVVALGWVLDRASGKGGLAASVVLLFLDGMGLMVRSSRQLVRHHCTDADCRRWS